MTACVREAGDAPKSGKAVVHQALAPFLDSALALIAVPGACRVSVLVFSFAIRDRTSLR